MGLTQENIDKDSYLSLMLLQLHFSADQPYRVRTAENESAKQQQPWMHLKLQ